MTLMDLCLSNPSLANPDTAHTFIVTEVAMTDCHKNITGKMLNKGGAASEQE